MTYIKVVNIYNILTQLLSTSLSQCFFGHGCKVIEKGIYFRCRLLKLNQKQDSVRIHPLTQNQFHVPFFSFSWGFLAFLNLQVVPCNGKRSEDTETSADEQQLFLSLGSSA